MQMEWNRPLLRQVLIKICGWTEMDIRERDYNEVLAALEMRASQIQQYLLSQDAARLYDALIMVGGLTDYELLTLSVSDIRRYVEAHHAELMPLLRKLGGPFPCNLLSLEGAETCDS